MSCEVLLDPEKVEYCGQINLAVIGYNESGTRKVYDKYISISKTPNVWIGIGAVLNVDSDIDMSGTEYNIGIRIQTGTLVEARGKTLNLQIRNIMIAEGDVATTYEPYHKYKIPVVARGRNLIKLNTKSYSANGGTITNNQDGTYTLSGTPTGHCGLLIGSIPSSLLDVLRNNVCVLTGFYYYEKNVRITLNVKLNGSYIKYIYLNPYTYKNYVQVDLRTTEFDEITFGLSNQNNNVDFKNVTVKPLLEVGTTMPTSFEPYIAPVTTNIFLDEPLRKVGDYADYVDFEKQKVVRNVSRTDSLRAGNIYNWNNRNGIMTASVLKYNSTRLKGMSNRLNVFTAIGNETCTFWLGVGNRVIYWVGILDVLGIYSDSKTSKEMIEEFNTWLADNPTYVIYPLTTPTEETVKLPAIPQFKGTTIYEVGTNIKPSGMEAKYC